MPRGEKLSVPHKYQHFALVTFSRGFPIDGLRYDHCHPWREEDSRAIEDSMFQLVWDQQSGGWLQPDNEDVKERKVIVTKYSETATTPYWSPERENSHSAGRIEPITAEEAHNIDRDPDKVPQRLEYERVFRARDAA